MLAKLVEIIRNNKGETLVQQRFFYLQPMRVITRTIFILSLVSLFADIASEILYPVIPIYLDHIGFSMVGIGLLEGIANFTSGISKGYFGKLSDEKGKRLPFVKLGYLFSTISKPMIVIFSWPVWIFFARTLDRLGKGIRTAARDALLSAESTRETKGKVFGFHRTMDTLGATIGPLLALLYLFYRPGDYKTVFYLAFIPGVISILLIFLLKEKTKPVSTLKKGNFFSFFGYFRVASQGYRKMVVGLLLFALFNSSDFFLLLVTRQAIGDQSIQFAGTTFTGDTITIAAYVFYNLIYAIGSYPLGSLSDKLGFKTIFMTGMILYALVYGGFAFNPSIPVIFGLFLVYGLFSAATDGIVKAWITNMAHETNTATAVGFYTSCESICTLLASLVAGLVWNYYGSFYTFLIPAIIAVIVFFYFAFSSINSESL